MKLKIEIDIGNSGMSTRGHLANAVRGVANQILEIHKWFQMAGTQHKIFDLNGNSVGFWKIEKEEGDDDVEE